jgi:hypothetical protein
MPQDMRPVVTTLRLLAIGTTCAVVTLAGCFKLARPTPPLEEYVLGGALPAMRAAPARSTGAVTLGLRRLDLAPYLATTAIIVRRGSSISSSGFRRWGESPAAGIMRAVSGYLSTAPGVAAVDIAPWPVAAPHDYLVQLHIDRLEGVVTGDSSATTGEAYLLASWEVIRSADGALLARGRTERRDRGWTVGDYRGLVSRIELGLSGLAGDLTACIARLSPRLPAIGASEGGPIVECAK